MTRRSLAAPLVGTKPWAHGEQSALPHASCTRTLPRPPQARLANVTTTRSPLEDEPGWATHTSFPNFGKVEYFCDGRLTASRVFCPSGDERPSPEASSPQSDQGLAPEEGPRITLAIHPGTGLRGSPLYIICLAQKKHPAVSRRVFVHVFRQILPVALSAEDHGDRVLVLQFVNRGRLSGNNVRDEANRTGVLLVEVGPGDVSRERQVLDRGPAGDDTELADREVRVTTRHARQATEHAATTAGAAEGGLGLRTELGLSVGTVERGVPVGIPVVGVSATEAPGLDGFLRAAVHEHRIGSAGEADAAVSASNARI